METVGRALSWVVWLAIAVGWGLILLPGMVKRLRRDPQPHFPLVPLAQPLGHDGSANASFFWEAVRSVVSGAVSAPGEEPNEVWVTSSALARGEGVVLSWDEWGPTVDAGTFYVDLTELGGEAFYELDVDTDVSEVFWIVVGYLRDGVERRQGRAWVYLAEVGLWHAYSGSVRMSDFDPEWSVQLPA